jgi:mitochondrial import inner membrane translocase subunit TIM17
MPRQSGMADREPCPWRIVDDVGGAFCMGCIGGAVWHSVRGARLAVAARSPVLGGQFAVWGGLFAVSDCTLTAIRQKEDPWNSILSGAITGGVLAARAGPQQMASAAVVGGVLLALIEGMGIMFTKMMAPPVPTAEDYARDVTAPPTAGGFFGALGGGGPSPFGSSSPSSADPPGALAPSSHNEPYLETDGTTTFSTEVSRTTSAESNSNNSSWWPFGGSQR